MGDALRVDVREATRAAAAAESEHNDTCLVLMSRVLVDELSTGWSPAMKLMVVREENGLVDLVVREAR